MNSVQLKFLGGTREVGRSAISLRTSTTQILLDYGVMLGREPGFPMHISPKEVDGIVLSHSHLDHSGGLPIFYIDQKIPLYTTRLTSELSELLISDFIHLSNYFLPFEYLELNTMMSNTHPTQYNSPVTIGDLTCTLLNGGHIPGSAMVLIETGGKAILYTSDFNTAPSRLLDGAQIPETELDAVLIESTYANANHSDRLALEKKFILEITDVVEHGGTVLVPAFGVGRSQEMACILAAHNFAYPVAIDGMVRKANNIISRNSSFLRDPQLFNKMLTSTTWVKSWKDRRKIAKQPGVIVTTAGMLKGGPSIFYMSNIGKKLNSAVFLVSFQIPGTPGRELLDNGVFTIDGTLKKIKARVGHFDFSSHCGSNDLQYFIQNLRGHPKVFVMHGEETNCISLANWAKTTLNSDVAVPKTGEEYTI